MWVIRGKSMQVAPTPSPPAHPLQPALPPPIPATVFVIRLAPGMCPSSPAGVSIISESGI